MDLERIKQNLRLRSQRPKKTRSRTAPVERYFPNVDSAALLDPITGKHDLVRPKEGPNRQAQEHLVNAAGSADQAIVEHDLARPKEDRYLQGQDHDANSAALLDRSIEDHDLVLPKKVSNLPEDPVVIKPSVELHKRFEIPNSRKHHLTKCDACASLHRVAIGQDGSASSRSKPKRELASLSRLGKIDLGRERRAGTERPPRTERRKTEPHPLPYSGEDINDFDLRPPPPRPKAPGLDTLSDQLFSEGYLNYIMHDVQMMARFTKFLNCYRPEISLLLASYLEAQKSIKAIEYANAVAESIMPPSTETTNEAMAVAAKMDSKFEEMAQAALDVLVNDALPAYVTYSLIKNVSDILVAETIGRSPPRTSGLIGGLSEVFCLTDPNQADNPIIYASEEFYRLTGYGRDDVIGQNCRFLQGPRTKRSSSRRLKESCENGVEVSEALLNYRRDGSTFLNLLMIAPLYDGKGHVKYNIGAQVDVSKIVERKKGLDGFEQYTKRIELKIDQPARQSEVDATRKALLKLKELSEMFDQDEIAVVKSRSRSSSKTRERDDAKGPESGERPITARRILEDPDRHQNGEPDEDGDEKRKWSLAGAELSGNLPAYYQNYFLVRPAPSLRIIFVSPALHKLGDVVQSPLMAHVAAPRSTLSGLKESLQSGVPVSARINFMSAAGRSSDGLVTQSRRPGMNESKVETSGSSDEKIRGRPCWISATPLFGSDDLIGVWMVVLVEKPATAPLASNELKPGSVMVSQETHAHLPEPRTPTNGGKSVDSPLFRPEHEEMPVKPTVDEEGTTPTKHEFSSMGLNDNPVDLHGNCDRPQIAIRNSHAVLTNEVENDETDHEILQAHAPPSYEDDDQYFKRREPSAASSTPDRLHFQTYSDDEESQSPSDSGHRSRTLLPDWGEEDQLATPTLSRTDREWSPASENHDHGPESNSARPTGMSYIDYLRHPGTGRAHGDAQTNESSDETEPDCSRSPYSVD